MKVFIAILMTYFISLNVQAQNSRMIVKFDDVQKEQISELKKKGGKLLKYDPTSLIVNLSDVEAKQLTKKYKGIKVEPDYTVSILGKPGSTVIQPSQSTPWGIRRIQAVQAHQLNKGANVLVCVVDTGVQKSHPDLQANIAGGENFVVIRGKVDPNKWDDDNGHGTHVSGTIAALDNDIGVIGVAPESKIFAVKVLDKSGSGYSSAVADGIRSCVVNGAKVINMSLGSSSSSSVIQDAVKFAYENGAILVAAAGNEGASVGYPAKYPEVLAVSAMDSNDQIASFSNTGPEVDYIAPGVGIVSTTKGSGYANYSGTSMATPHVSGILALMLSANMLEVFTEDVGLTMDQQGLGLPDAFRTVQGF